MSIGQKVDFSNTLVPASAAQQRLWFLYQLNPADTSYNMPQAFRLRGQINRTALRDSLNRIIDRHETLRTTFAIRDHQPIQKIHPSLVIELPVIDFPAKSAESDDVRIQAAIDQQVRKPFDLVRGPLIRAVLFRIGTNDHVLLIVEHHIIFDRTSEGLFFKELSTLYEHFGSGGKEEDLRLPELPIQYSDYTKWRIEHNRDDVLTPQLNYWRDHLEGIKPLELPTDRPRSKSISTRGERLYFELPADTVDGIDKLARKNGATMFMGLLAVFDVLLHHWTGSSDITVGTPFADRRLNGTKQLLGFFVNNIILRTTVPEDSNYLQLLRHVRKVCFGAYRNNSVPFEKLVEYLRPDRQENRNPLFDVQFAFQKLHADPLVFGDVSTSLMTPAKGTSQYDITFTVREQVDGYDARIEYRTDLFDADSMTRLLHRFGDLLEVIVKDPERKLSTIPLLDQVELGRITKNWNDTFVDYPRDTGIHKLIEDQVLRTPDAIAVTFGENSISYRDLDLRANRLANFLKSSGFGPECIGAICIERSIEMVVGLLAILKAGGAYLPLDRSYPNNRLQHMLDDSDASVLLTSSDLLKELPMCQAHTILIDRDAKAIELAGDTPPQVDVRGDNLAYVIYTSGSTGLPKGVQIEHHNAVNFLCSMKREPGMQANDVLLAVTTLSFDIAVLEIFLPLTLGARTVIASREVVINGELMHAVLQRERVTMMQATPVTWRMLIDAGWQGNDSFKVLCGGEAMPRELAQDLVRRAGAVWNMYGPTETTVWSTCYRLADANAPILIGRPIANTSIYVLDPQMRPVPVGRTGELFIGGEGVTRGYLRRPELTAERYVPSPFDANPDARLYATGDGVRYLPDGNIEYLNRLDNQVKVRGNRIELGEIQAAIVANDSVSHAVVIVREDQPGDARIAAYYVPEPGRLLAANELRNKLRETLPAYMIPQYFVELESLPLTPNGKIDRKALPAPDLKALALSDGYRAPRTASEISLATIWQELLGLDKVGIHDNFVEMGGHSLLALQAISRIKQEFGVNVSAMSMIMDTLEQIATQFGDESPAVVADAGIGTQFSSVRPLYFGPSNSLFGLHHVPSDDRRRDTCILLCGPIYIESMTAHWALKRLADGLVRQGFHVLRFDYFGSGDSMGESRDGNLSRWLEDVRSAASKLRDLSDTKRLSIVGLRFGATLAAMSGLDDLADLVLWDPITDGAEYMEYMRERHQSMIEICDAHRDKPITQSDHELLGYYCPPESQETIAATRLAESFNHSPERVILVLQENCEDYSVLEHAMQLAGNSVERHVVDDARCDIADRGRLSAFLPGPSLKVITSVLSENIR